jgi:hypothetical protein
MFKVWFLFRLHGCTRHGRSDNSPRFNAGRARIHLSLERWRVCETWFAPSMAGVDSAGLGEVLQNVLASFSLFDRERLVQVRAFLSLSLPPCLMVFLPILTLTALIHAERVSHGYASANARSLGPLTRDAPPDSPTRDAAPYRARRRHLTGRVARHGRVCADRGICERWRDQGRV